MLTLYCTCITYKDIAAECTGHTCTFQLLQAGFRDTLASSLADIVLLQLVAEPNIIFVDVDGKSDANKRGLASNTSANNYFVDHIYTCFIDMFGAFSITYSMTLEQHVTL